MPLEAAQAKGLITGNMHLDVEHRRCIVGGEPMIFHCHHYNVYLQRSIRDASYIDSAPFLIGAGSEVAYAQLRTLFQATGLAAVDERKTLAETLLAWSGFGTISLSDVSGDGGTVATPHAHYAIGWKAKFGPAPEPVSFFTTGWLAGALAAIYDLPQGSFSARQTACPAAGTGTLSVFVLQRENPAYAVFDSPGVGRLSTHQVRPVPANNVDYEGILAALASMELVGDATGMIPAFGVYLTRHYANYYNRISFELGRALSAMFGAEGREVAEPLLVEAGHACAFNTFGGIMESAEWDALIRPQLQSREDWVHGIVAVVNALGWGRWQVTALSEREAEFTLHDDYESVGYCATYGQTDHPVSYLAQGGVAGIMNLVYLGNIAEKPDLTPEFYDHLFGRADVYKAEVLSSLAMGEPVTAFRVKRGG